MENQVMNKVSFFEVLWEIYEANKDNKADPYASILKAKVKEAFEEAGYSFEDNQVDAIDPFSIILSLCAVRKAENNDEGKEKFERLFQGIRKKCRESVGDLLSEGRIEDSVLPEEQELIEIRMEEFLFEEDKVHFSWFYNRNNESYDKSDDDYKSMIEKLWNLYGACILYQNDGKETGGDNSNFSKKEEQERLSRDIGTRINEIISVDAVIKDYLSKYEKAVKAISSAEKSIAKQSETPNKSTPGAKSKYQEKKQEAEKAKTEARQKLLNGIFPELGLQKLSFALAFVRRDSFSDLYVPQHPSDNDALTTKKPSIDDYKRQTTCFSVDDYITLIVEWKSLLGEMSEESWIEKHKRAYESILPSLLVTINSRLFSEWIGYIDDNKDDDKNRNIMITECCKVIKEVLGKDIKETELNPFMIILPFYSDYRDQNEGNQRVRELFDYYKQSFIRIIIEKISGKNISTKAPNYEKVNRIILPILANYTKFPFSKIWNPKEWSSDESLSVEDWWQFYGILNQSSPSRIVDMKQYFRETGDATKKKGYEKPFEKANDIQTLSELAFWSNPSDFINLRLFFDIGNDEDKREYSTTLKTAKHLNAYEYWALCSNTYDYLKPINDTKSDTIEERWKISVGKILPYVNMCSIYKRYTEKDDLDPKALKDNPDHYDKIAGYTKDDLTDDDIKAIISVTNKTVKTLLNAIKKSTVSFDLNTILYGPPGTGKTFNVVQRALQIIEPEELWFLPDLHKEEDRYKRFRELRDEKRIGFVTFHQSYSYEDFIEGLKPILKKTAENSEEDAKSTSGEGTDADSKRHEADALQYTIEAGVFKAFCDEAKKEENASNNYVFIIDEINRGDISRIFGELITLIEDEKRKGNNEDFGGIILPYSKEAFEIPANVYILGTMNTADRSIALIDTALRRRFSFEEMMPDPEVLVDSKTKAPIIIEFKDYLVSKEITENKETKETPEDQGDKETVEVKETKEVFKLNIPRMLEVINNRIEFLLDREHTIGHAFFMRLKNKKDNTEKAELLKAIFEKKIIPLLQEYFFEDYSQIQKVLGKGFVEKRSSDAFNLPKGVEDNRRGTIERYYLVDSQKWDGKAFFDLLNESD